MWMVKKAYDVQRLAGDWLPHSAFHKTSQMPFYINIPTNNMLTCKSTKQWQEEKDMLNIWFMLIRIFVFIRVRSIDLYVYIELHIIIQSSSILCIHRNQYLVYKKIREYVFIYMKILLPQKRYPFVCQSKKRKKKKKALVLGRNSWIGQMCVDMMVNYSLALLIMKI
jgi:hypothetical protein